ncbi:hypothetical protein Nepgr_004530 [Nepenthes gracilis]|uniref:Uncharacterized protein n=1 Tax=Nepenthes gracilis TaxID=150966 RepID=A0AAD3S211_NEPGR|nr:hypothetical protein Nepgr_004530 [Nepenthes gracilis]
MGWAPGGKLVALVGGFNNRNPNAKVLTRDKIGAWKTLLPNETAGSAPTPHDFVDEANVFSHLQPEIPKSLRIPTTKLFTKPLNIASPKRLNPRQPCFTLPLMHTSSLIFIWPSSTF